MLNSLTAKETHAHAALEAPITDFKLLAVQYDFGNYMETLPESASSPTQSVGATRKLMEEVARESVKALSNVTVRPGSWVSGLKLADGHERIQGRLPSSQSCIFSTPGSTPAV